MTRAALRASVRRILGAGLRAVEPGRLVREHLALRGADVHVGGTRVVDPSRVFVVAVGKGALAMAGAAHRILGKRVSAGVVLAPVAAPPRARWVNFVARHPIPDAEGVRAGRHVIRLLEQAGEGDLVLLLLSGGASALMPAPIDGVSLRDKQHVTRLLLARGADIAQTNAVRKQLSRLKGGGFARIAAPARVIALALSDVPGDDVGTIGSGPAVFDPDAASEARRAARRFLKRSDVSSAVWAAITRTNRGGRRGAKPQTKIIGSGHTFAKAAQDAARALGFSSTLLRHALKGEARAMGPALVRAFERRRRSTSLCVIATGETVVTVTGSGQGGRNQELALSAVPALGAFKTPVVLASFATDGVDGPTTAAGGLVDDRTAAKARRLRVSIDRALDRNDSYRALKRLGGLIVTAKTGTNVADLVVILG